MTKDHQHPLMPIPVFNILIALWEFTLIVSFSHGCGKSRRRPSLSKAIFFFVFPTQTSNVFSSQTFLRSVGFRLVLCFLYIWLLWPNLDRHHSRNAWQQQPLDGNFERQTKSCSFLRRKSPAKSAEKDRRETKYGLFRN